MAEKAICVKRNGSEFWVKTPLDAYFLILREVYETEEDSATEEARDVALEVKAVLEEEMPNEKVFEFDGFTVEITDIEY